MEVDIITEALVKVEKQNEKYKPIKVEKLIEVTYDLGTLLASDTNDLDVKELRTHKEKYLKNLARDNTQLLFIKIWKLPTENVEDAIVVYLPEQKYVLPREKPIPKPKPLTKWQKFAQEKGLKKTKKSKTSWDEVLKKWVPMHGYKRAAAKREQQWLVEVPQNADPYMDVFADKASLKKERVAKNEFQRLRNIAVAKKVKVPRVGILTAEKLPAEQLKTAALVARVSTASIGKYQPKLLKEKQIASWTTDKGLQGIRKRKPSPLSPTKEKTSNLNIIYSILNKKPKVDIKKSTDRHMFEEQKHQSTEKKKKSQGKGKKRSTFGNKKGKGAGKNSSVNKTAVGKGNRTQGGGKKRR